MSTPIFDPLLGCVFGPNADPKNNDEIEENIKKLLNIYEDRFNIFQAFNVEKCNIFHKISELMVPVFNAKLCELYKWDINSFLLIIASFFGTKYVLTDENEEKQDKTQSIDVNSLKEKDLSPEVKFPLHTIILMCYASSRVEQFLMKESGQDLELEKFKKSTENLENWATRLIDEMYASDRNLALTALKIDYRDELRNQLHIQNGKVSFRNGSQKQNNNDNKQLLPNQSLHSYKSEVSAYLNYLEDKYGKSKEIMAIAFKAGAMKFLSTKCCQNYIDCRYYGRPIKRQLKQQDKTEKRGFSISAKYKLHLHTLFRVAYIVLFSYMLCRYPTSNQSMLHSMTSPVGTICWYIIISVLGAQFFTTFVKVLDMMNADRIGVSVNAEQPQSRGYIQEYRKKHRWLNKYLSNNKLTFFRCCIIPVLFIFELVRFVGTTNIVNRILSFFFIIEKVENNWFDSVFVPILSEIIYCVLFAIAAISSLRYFQNILSLGFFLHLLTKMLKTVAMFVLIFFTFWYVLAVIHVSISRTLMQTEDTFLYTVTSKGKFEVFGEVGDEDSKGSLPECSTFNRTILDFFNMSYPEASCLIRSSIIPFLLFVYMFVTGILLMNLLTAQLTKEYEKESEKSKNYTGYLKYEQLSKIESKMILPPPFSWIYILLRLIAIFFCDCINRFIYEFLKNNIDGNAWGTVNNEELKRKDIDGTIEVMRNFMLLKPESLWNILKNEIDEYARSDETDENIQKVKTELVRLIESRTVVNRERSHTRLSHHASIRTDVKPRQRNDTLGTLHDHAESATPTPTFDDDGCSFSYPDSPRSEYESCRSINSWQLDSNV